jgi:hypothetical protein
MGIDLGNRCFSSRAPVGVLTSGHSFLLCCHQQSEECARPFYFHTGNLLSHISDKLFERASNPRNAVSIYVAGVVGSLTGTQTWCLHRRWNMDGVPAKSGYPIDIWLLFFLALFLLYRGQTDLRDLRPVRFVGLQPRVFVQVCLRPFTISCSNDDDRPIS